MTIVDLKAIRGVGPATAEKLTDAGIASVEALLAADLDDLAERTGIARSRLDQFVDRARETEEPAQADADADAEPETAMSQAADAVQDVARQAGEAVEQVRVLLRDQAQSARVRLGTEWHENVPIVTARAQESAERILTGLHHNAVVLKEKTQTAWVRIGEEWHENVPIFKEHVMPDGRTEETRVEVREIREKRRDEERGFVDRVKRIFGR